MKDHLDEHVFLAETTASIFPHRCEIPGFAEKL